MEIFIDHNIVRASQALADEHLRQIPFAASLALNATAFRIAKRRLPRETQRRFEGGSTRWTKSGFAFIKSHKRNLVATIHVREKQQYLNLQIHGGIRRPEPRHAFMIPSKHSRRTKEGNVSRKMRKNYLQRALNARVHGRGRKSRHDDPAFVGRPSDDRSKPYGIWQRQQRGLKLLLEIDNENIRYRKKFKFYKYAKDEFHRFFDNELAIALQRAID